MKKNYLINTKAKVVVNQKTTVPASNIKLAIEKTHDILAKFKTFPVDVFALLGMRNLSGFVGEIFVAALEDTANGMFKKNPHQDGYPDLLLMDKAGRDLWRSLSERLQEKDPFSPFPTGGLEIKATCGSTPSASVLAKRGDRKPVIGESRIYMINNYCWAAHHRETNQLMSLLWDFDNGTPFIAAVFYSNNLTREDWGKISSPHGTGRTTSSCSLRQSGVKKLYNGWVTCIDDSRYINFLNKRNKSNLIS